jgi:hypothetical protein
MSASVNRGRACLFDLFGSGETNLADRVLEFRLAQGHVAADDHEDEFSVYNAGEHQRLGGFLFGEIQKICQRFDGVAIGR